MLQAVGGVGTGVTPEQQAAIAALQAAAKGTPDVAGMLTNSLNSANSNLDPIASGSLDPYSNPATRGMLDTLNEDITSQVKGQAAAAGRLDSGDYAKALGRGLSQGEGGLLFNQYNQNVGNRLAANNQMYGMTSNAAGQLPGLNMAGATNQMAAAQAGYGIPLSNIGQNADITESLAHLGTSGTSTGQSSNQGTSNQNYNSNNTGTSNNYGTNTGWNNSNYDNSGSTSGTSSGSTSGTSSGTSSGSTSGSSSGSTSGSTSGSNSSNTSGNTSGDYSGNTQNYSQSSNIANIMSLLGSFLSWSDVRLKHDVEPIGMLFDGLPVYSFSYNGETTPRVGLMAQDVEKVHPEAVVEIGGMKAVDYGRATERARELAKG